jgi:hypothetical protein
VGVAALAEFLDRAEPALEEELRQREEFRRFRALPPEQRTVIGRERLEATNA